jgi:gliding motility-associated-like protein
MYAQTSELEGYEAMMISGSSGGCDTFNLRNGRLIVYSWTIGEIVIEEQKMGNGIKVTAGFHQDWPDLFDIPQKKDAPDLSMVITPNGDGLNDLFVPVDNLQFRFPKNELVVFNRWGVVVFQAKPYENTWAGNNFQGDPLPEGTYYYLLRLYNNFFTTLKGSITIRR